MPSFHFTSTHDVATQLRNLAHRLEAVPDTEIPRTRVELDVQVYSRGTETSDVFDAVDHVTSILTDGQTEAELDVDEEYCSYGTHRATVTGESCPGGIPVAVVTVVTPDEVASLLLDNVEPLEVAA